MTGDARLVLSQYAGGSALVAEHLENFFLPFLITLVRTETCPWCAGAVVVVCEAGKNEHQSTIPTDFLGFAKRALLCGRVDT